jgi:hypothetical protein
MSNERGLVLSTLEIAQHDPDKVVVRDPWIPAQQLRFALLFWDKIDAAETTTMRFHGGPDETYLEDIGILQRTTVVRRSDRSHFFCYVDAPSDVWRHHESREPGVWSICQPRRSLSCDEPSRHAPDENGRGVLVKLHRAVPVPQKDVPLEDIVRFKEKRRPELLAFRHHLERLYQDIVASPDQALRTQSETEALQLAIADMIRSSRGSKMLWRLVDFDASLSLELPLATALAAGVAAVSGMPKVAELLVLTSAASLSVSVGPGMAGAKAHGTPFRYITSYHNELFPIS